MSHSRIIRPARTFARLHYLRSLFIQQLLLINFNEIRMNRGMLSR